MAEKTAIENLSPGTLFTDPHGRMCVRTQSTKQDGFTCIVLGTGAAFTCKVGTTVCRLPFPGSHAAKAAAEVEPAGTNEWLESMRPAQDRKATARTFRDEAGQIVADMKLEQAQQAQYDHMDRAIDEPAAHKEPVPRPGPKPRAKIGTFEFRDFRNDNGPTDGDEILWTDPVSNSAFHLERMADNAVWFCITARDPAAGTERQLHVNLVAGAGGDIRISLQDLPDEEHPTPEVQKPRAGTKEVPAPAPELPTDTQLLDILLSAVPATNVYDHGCGFTWSRQYLTPSLSFARAAGDAVYARLPGKETDVWKDYATREDAMTVLRDAVRGVRKERRIRDAE